MRFRVWVDVATSRGREHDEETVHSSGWWTVCCCLTMTSLFIISHWNIFVIVLLGFTIERREVVLSCLIFALTALPAIFSLTLYYYPHGVNTTCELDLSYLTQLISRVLLKRSLDPDKEIHI